MAHYLFQAAYSSDAWAAQIQNPQNRIDAVRAQVESLGGTIDHAWYAFGEYDLVAIVQMPDNVSMATMAIAIAAGGATKAAKTTPLMTIDEGIEAMTRAGSLTYQPPSAG